MSILDHCVCFKIYAYTLIPAQYAMKKGASLVFVCFAIFIVIYNRSRHQQQTTRQAFVFQSQDTLFSNGSEIRHCIMAYVIGIRPSVPLISFNKLVYHEEAENSEHRKAAFKKIFNKRLWGTNKGVKFSASGKLLRVINYCLNKVMFVRTWSLSIVQWYHFIETFASKYICVKTLTFRVTRRHGT